MPILDKLLYTTCKAANFSETNKTFLFLAISSEIMFAIVWLFPVPGGPCKTKLKPLIAFCIATSCELSESSAW